jgi:hypothetical protein
MRYIKIYEAFTSKKLSKTLKWINSDSIDKFKQGLIRVSKKIDFPISDFTDDMFKYLPYDEALDYGTGDNGTIGELKYVKFWFDSSGSFMGTTIIDGTTILTGLDFSRNVDDYIKSRKYESGDWEEFKQLPNGTPLLYNYRGTEFVSLLVRADGEHGDNQIYLLQDHMSGARMRNWQDFRKYSRFSWVLTHTMDGYWPVWSLVPKGFDKSEFRNYNIPMGEVNLKDSNFALILDVREIRGGKLSKILKTREENKPLNKPNELISKDNNIRYLEKIISGYDPHMDFKREFNSILKRGFGYNYVIFYILNFYGYINDIQYLISVGSRGEEIISRIKGLYSKVVDSSSIIKNNIKKMESSPNPYNRKFINELLDMSQLIYDKLTSSQIESEEDFFYRMEYINYIRRTLTRSLYNYVTSFMDPGEFNLELTEDEYKKLELASKNIRKYL